MRILTILSATFESGSPAIFKRTLPLMKELQRGGHEIKFLENYAWQEPSTLSTSSWLKCYASWSLNHKRLIIRYLLQDFDCDLVYSEKIEPTTLAYLLSKKMAIPFVIDSHDLERVNLLDKYINSIITSYLIKKAAKVFTISKELHKLYQNIRKDVIYLPSTADLGFFDPRKLGQVDKFNEITFIWCGNMKGSDFCELILQAFRKLNGEKLYLVGDGPKRQFYEKLTSELGLNKKVIFTGWVSDKELARLYKASDIGLLPFNDDLWNRCKAPSKLFEFMAMEIPFVCTVGEPAYMVEKLGCGLVAKPEVFDFSKKMAYAVKNLNELKDKAKEARKYLLEKQNFGVLAKKLEEELQSLV